MLEDDSLRKNFPVHHWIKSRFLTTILRF
jgi:hypothetical protein